MGDQSLVRLRKSWCAGLAAIFAAILIEPAAAAGVEDFYRGKTLAIVIGSSVGGGYDQYARVLARYLGRHIPGQPAIVPQNMPAAGGLRAAKYLYAAAPKDGTVIGTFSRSIAVTPLLSSDSSFDGTQYTWLGSVDSNNNPLCITSSKSSIKTWHDMLTNTVVLAGQGTGADANIFAHLYENVFGAKIKLVPGYPGTNDIMLAMDRGEVDGFCGGMSWTTLEITRPDWIRDKSVNVIIQAQAGVKSVPALASVPIAMEMTDDPEKKRILNLILGPHQVMARPFAALPGVPEDRKAALIKAFNDTVKDPEFLATAEKVRMEVSPTTAGEIDALLRELYATPKHIVAQTAKAITE
jgi:tripartite-type tricarboxylate transporter receptor subunit TctC